MLIMSIKVLQFNMGKGKEAGILMNKKVKKERPDIIMIQEPYHKYVTPQGYIRFGDRSKKAITLVKSSLDHVIMRTDLSNDNIVVIKINGESEIHVINIYDEPEINNRGVNSRFIELSNKIDHTYNKLLIAGDINAKNISWGGEINNYRGNYIEDWALLNNVKIENEPQDEPSHYSTRGVGWLDLVMTKNIRIENRKINTTEDTLSDHRYISYDLIMKFGKKQKKIRYETSNENKDRFQIKLRQLFEIGNRNDFVNVNEKADWFQQLCVDTCKLSLKRTKIRRGPTREWWNNDLENLRKNTRRYRKEFQDSTPDLKEEKKRRYINVRREYKREIKKAKNRDLVEELEEASHDPWKFLSRWVKGGKSNLGNMTVRKENGDFTTSEAETTAVLIRKYFPNDPRIEDSPEQRQKRIEFENININVNVNLEQDRDFTLITRSELKGIIKLTKKNKATSDDSIPNECMEWVEEAIGEWWCELLNECLIEGKFPMIWKKANIVWVPKKAGDVRPISLLPALGKIFDRLLAGRIAHHMESENRFSNRQFGFRNGRDTTAAMENLVEIIKTNKNNGLHSLVVALDLSNAFGNAWGPAVVNNMLKHECEKGMIRVVADFVRDRKIIIEKDSWTMEKGCPQGSSLGPILWIVLMEDWFARLADQEEIGVKGQAYADDQIIIIPGTSVRRIENKWQIVWQDCLNWAEENKLQYNNGKTEAVFITSDKNIREPIINIGNTRINCKQSITYLGIVLDKKLNWIQHIKKTRAKIKNLGHKYIILSKKRWGNNKSILKLLYERAIIPAIMYGVNIWGVKSTDTRVRKQLNSMERPFLRGITTAYATAPTAALSVMSGCVPLNIRARMAYESHRIWDNRIGRLKVLMKDRPHPAFRNIEFSTEDDDKVIKVWVDGVKRGLDRKGFGVARQDDNNRWIGYSGKVNGNCEITDLEELAILEGIKWITNEIDPVNTETTIIIYTDSKVTTGKIKNFQTNRKIVNQIQNEIVTNIGREINIIVVWQKRGSVGNKKAEQFAIQGIENGNRESNLEIVKNKDKREWVRTNELRLWQEAWDSDLKGRWAYRWVPEVGREVMPLSHKAVQLITGHGNFAASLRRFNLTDREVVCECGLADESAEHIALHCHLEKHVRERDRIRRTYGVCPPINVNRPGIFEAVNNWAECVVPEVEPELE